MSDTVKSLTNRMALGRGDLGLGEMCDSSFSQGGERSDYIGKESGLEEQFGLEMVGAVPNLARRPSRPKSAITSREAANSYALFGAQSGKEKALHIYICNTASLIQHDGLYVKHS